MEAYKGLCIYKTGLRVSVMKFPRIVQIVLTFVALFAHGLADLSKSKGLEQCVYVQTIRVG